jgi:hypothetical protein
MSIKPKMMRKSSGRHTRDVLDFDRGIKYPVVDDPEIFPNKTDRRSQWKIGTDG